MRVITLDQYEFADSSSEESLEIAVAMRGKFPFPDIENFIAARLDAGERAMLPAPVPYRPNLGLGRMVDHLDRHAGIALPHHGGWSVQVLASKWNEVNVVICAPDKFIHYLWWTSA